MKLEGRVAIVTGGARGIGAGIARALAAEGARVVVADLDDAQAELTAEQLGGGAIALFARLRTVSRANKPTTTIATVCQLLATQISDVSAIDGAGSGAEARSVYEETTMYG